MANRKPDIWCGRPLPQGYERDLERIVDEIFNEAFRRDWTWADLARFAGLNHHTVWRLGERMTKVPQFLTFWKLCRAVQFSIQMTPTRISLVKERRQQAKAAS